MRCRGAAVRGSAGAQQCGAGQGRGAGLRRGAAWGCVGVVGARRARRGGGGGLWAGGWVRARGGRGCGELSRTASPCGRPGGGAAGAGQSRPGSPGRLRCRGGRGQRWGPHPARRGRIPSGIIHGGEYWWRRGERRTVPSRPNRTGTGPAGGIPGGRAGLGIGAPGPGSLVVVGRRGGDRAGLWVAAGEGGRGRAGRARGRTPRGPRGLGEGSRARPFLEGGGGCSLPGLRRGAAWCGAGAHPCGAAEGRSSVGPCRGAACGRAGVQRGAAEDRGVGPRMGAARGRARVRRGAAQGCSVGLRRGAARGRAWARHGAGQGRSSVGLRRGAPWGCLGAQQRGAEQGRSVGQRRGAARG